MFQFIEVKNNNQTCVITINREDVFNALNRETKFELMKAIEEANKDQSVRSIILTAKGKAFCSGQDLNDRNVNPSQRVDLGKALEEEWNPLMLSIRNSEKLVIAAINGVCAGAGLSLALNCDMKIAPPATRFISGFVQIGLVPDAGMSAILINSMGYSKALEFALMGKPLLSEQMLQFNLINEIAEAPLEKALEIASHINTLAPLAVKMMKQNLKVAMDVTFNESLEQEKTTQRTLGFSEDYREGVSAFFEKRKPQFLGR